MAKHVGPEISFKSFTGYHATHEKITDASLLQNIKFPRLPALRQGRMPSSANLSQRCWMVNVPQFRCKGLFSTGDYKPQQRVLTQGQRSLFRTRAVASWQPLLAHCGSQNRGQTTIEQRSHRPPDFPYRQ